MRSGPYGGKRRRPRAVLVLAWVVALIAPILGQGWASSAQASALPPRASLAGVAAARPPDVRAGEAGSSRASGLSADARDPVRRVALDRRAKLPTPVPGSRTVLPRFHGGARPRGPVVVAFANGKRLPAGAVRMVAARPNAERHFVESPAYTQGTIGAGDWPTGPNSPANYSCNGYQLLGASFSVVPDPEYPGWGYQYAMTISLNQGSCNVLTDTGSGNAFVGLSEVFAGAPAGRIFSLRCLRGIFRRAGP
jgi:hypothetical protein